MHRTEPTPNQRSRSVKRYGPKKVNPSTGQLSLPKELLRDWGLDDARGVQFDVFANPGERSIILVEVGEDEAIDSLVLEAELEANRKRTSEP